MDDGIRYKAFLGETNNNNNGFRQESAELNLAKASMRFESESRKAEEKKKRLSRELECGSTAQLECYRTGLTYTIKSEKMNPRPKVKALEPPVITKDLTPRCIPIRAGDDSFNRHFRKKHYYIYSRSPGWGKTWMAEALMSQTNAAYILNYSNQLPVDDTTENAQFLLIDDFGPDRRFPQGVLDCLTRGPAYSVNDEIRRDAQLVIFSNYHLFDVMGSKCKESGSNAKVRKVELCYAQKLMQRFFIWRLDEKPGDNEKTDRMKHIEKKQMTPFVDDEEEEYVPYYSDDEPTASKRIRTDDV